MVKSDHSEAEDGGDMSPLQMSSDSMETITKKRPWLGSEDQDEQDLTAKKQRISFSEKSKILRKDNPKIISEKNDIVEYDVKEETYAMSFENKQNLNEKSLSDSNINNKNEGRQEYKLINKKNENESCLENKNNFNMSTNSVQIVNKATIEESKDSPSKESTNINLTPIYQDRKINKEVINTVKKEVDKSGDEEEESEKYRMKEKKKFTAKNQIMDIEVVDGLELSVECASDKEDSSSENEDKEDTKPRPKTIIVKAEPNESELECSSSEGEKSNSQEITDTVEVNKPEKKKGRKRGTRTNFNKLKLSGSEDSQNNNSDEDYSPRTKKKVKKSPMAKRGKKGRGGRVKKNSYKKNIENLSDDENSDAILTDKINEMVKIKDEVEDALSENDSLASKNESNSNFEDEEKSTRGRRRRSNAKPEDNKQIQMLKKYLNVAGIKVRCYNEIWSNCNSNISRIKRLRELLEKNGISGRPTLEKCRRAKEKNEKIREVSELDTSNIISEGRVTRARRNMGNNKKVINTDISRYRETRNTFKRIQTVVDSDSE